MNSEVDRKYCLLQIARVKAHRGAEESGNHADAQADPAERCEMQDGLRVKILHHLKLCNADQGTRTFPREEGRARWVRRGQGVACEHDPAG